MLNRQKTILALLQRAGRPLHPTSFVKMVFLLRQETGVGEDDTFYDFIPYKYGPFSFALYHDVDGLQENGYIRKCDNSIALCETSASEMRRTTEDIPFPVRAAVYEVWSRYGKMSQSDLLQDVYSRYPWYATKSELASLKPKNFDMPVSRRSVIYTAGYEGKSIDAFFKTLLLAGIERIVDVRANPLSRSYGFSKSQLSGTATKLGVEYCHIPTLGIPSSYRTALTDYESYQRLLDKYEQEMLPGLTVEVVKVGSMIKERATVLMCVERDVRCCHRSRLADAIFRRTGLEVKHL